MNGTTTEFSIQRKIINGHRIIKAISHQFPDVYLFQAREPWREAKDILENGGLSEDGKICSNEDISTLVDRAIKKANELVIDSLYNQIEKYSNFLNGNFDKFHTELTVIQADFDRETNNFKNIGIKCKELQDKIEKILAGRKKELDKLENEKYLLYRTMSRTKELVLMMSDENKLVLDGIVELADNRLQKFPAEKEETTNLIDATAELVDAMAGIESQVKKQQEIKDNLQCSLNKTEKDILGFNKEKRQALEMLQMSRQDIINEFVTGKITNETIIAQNEAIKRYLEKTRKFFCK